MRRWIEASCGFALALLLPAVAAAQPDLGHKLPGTLGLDAGRQREPGLYGAYRFVHWDAIHLRDRNGVVIPASGFDLDAFVHARGAAATVRLRSGLHVGIALAIPVVRLSLRSDQTGAETDRFGLGDVFVEPLQLGGRWRRVHLVGQYAFYVPTRQIAREGIGAPQWSHQLSFGATLFFADAVKARVSALFSWDHYHRKLGTDITRGDSLQVQGGFGGAVFEIVEIGAAYYALWQVRDDRGADLPAQLRGRRDLVVGLGPELNLLVPALGAKLGVRYTRDLVAHGRPEGQLVIAGLAVRFAVAGMDRARKPCRPRRLPRRSRRPRLLRERRDDRDCKRVRASTRHHARPEPRGGPRDDSLRRGGCGNVVPAHRRRS
jgi:hypothetical protein